MNDSKFSTPQQEALQHAYDQLGEQFDGVLIVVMASLEPTGNKEAHECVRSYYSGGRTLAVGLAEDAKHTIQTRGANSFQDEP